MIRKQAIRRVIRKKIKTAAEARQLDDTLEALLFEAALRNMIVLGHVSGDDELLTSAMDLLRQVEQRSAAPTRHL